MTYEHHMTYNTNMTDTQTGTIQPESVQQNEAANVPKEFHITITDNQSGRVLADYITDIAIVGGVKKEGEKATTSIMWVGDPFQLQQMLGLVFKSVGDHLGNLYNKMQSNQPKEDLSTKN